MAEPLEAAGAVATAAHTNHEALPKEVERSVLFAQPTAPQGGRAELAHPLGIRERSSYRKLREIKRTETADSWT